MHDVLRLRTKNKTKQSVAGIAAKKVKYAARMPKQAEPKTIDMMAMPEKVENTAFPVPQESRPSYSEVMNANSFKNDLEMIELAKQISAADVTSSVDIEV